MKSNIKCFEDGSRMVLVFENVTPEQKKCIAAFVGNTILENSEGVEPFINPYSGIDMAEPDTAAMQQPIFEAEETEVSIAAQIQQEIAAGGLSAVLSHISKMGTYTKKEQASCRAAIKEYVDDKLPHIRQWGEKDKLSDKVRQYLARNIVTAEEAHITSEKIMRIYAENGISSENAEPALLALSDETLLAIYEAVIEFCNKNATPD